MSRDADGRDAVASEPSREPIMCREFDTDESSPALPNRFDLLNDDKCEISICQECGREAPTQHVEFYAWFGLIIMWHCHAVAGCLCKTCVHKAFWSCQCMTAICGWWSPASLLVTPVILFSNICQYVQCCLTLRPVPRGAKPPQLTDEAVERLRPFADDIAGRLKQGERGNDLAWDVAPKAGVTPGQVLLFIWRRGRERQAPRLTAGYHIDVNQTKTRLHVM